MNNIPMGSQNPDTGVAINLASLRTELAQRFTLLLIVSGGIGLWICIPQSPFPSQIFGLLTVLVIYSYAVRNLLAVQPVVGRRLLIGGLLCLLIAAMLVLDTVWLPFLGSLLVFASAILIRHAEIVVAGCICLAVLVAGVGMDRGYPMPGLLIFLGFSAIFSSLVSNTVFTALSWESQMRQQSLILLSEIREHRGRLSQVVKSLNHAYEQQKYMQQELIQARRVAEEARRLKEQFAANISHELRTPLNLVLGFTEVMYRNPEVYGTLTWPTKLRRDIAQVYRNTQHLVGMIDDILDLSRIEIASFALNIEPTLLTPFVREVAQIAKSLFTNRAVYFIADIPEELPTIELDRTRVRQVILNLLNNAARFTEQGSVRLSVWPEDSAIVFQVQDTGIGIPSEKLPQLFSEFFQVDSSVRRSRSGAGLGLAISKKFVEAHGGRIWAESIEDEGTTFSFTLPVESIPGRLARPRPASSEVPDQRRLLLVGVQAPVAAHIMRYLKEFEVVAVQSPGEIDQAIKEWEPAAVLWNNSIETVDSTHILDDVPIPVIECPLSFVLDEQPQPLLFDTLAKPVTSRQLLDKLDLHRNVSHILVVDDDIGFIQLMERFIEASTYQYTITYAFTGYDALSAMREQQPDIVLLGTTLSDLSATEIMAVMASEKILHAIPIILVTASEPARMLDVVLTGPVTIHYMLGFKPGELLHLLSRILESLVYPRTR